MANAAPKVLVAPDSFKGSLTAANAAGAIRRGILRALPSAIVDACPLADGGEGTLDVLLGTKGGAARSRTVTGPRRGAVSARWGSFPDGLAVVEAAQAIGLELVPEADRHPLEASSYGVGELVRDALDGGARSILVALGGTATMDLGTGMAQALGVEFDGGSRPMTGGALSSVTRVRTEGIDPRLRGVPIRIAADVSNPLCGELGAPRTYGPQKGATPEEIETLEREFSRIAALVGDKGEVPGDGAAGGIAFLLRALFGGRVVNGAALVMDAVSFESRLDGADLVVTGEGRVDDQTVHGKVVWAVGKAARRRGVPVVALCGAVGNGTPALYEGIDAFFSLCDRPMDETAARTNAASLLENLAENVARLRFR